MSPAAAAAAAASSSKKRKYVDFTKRSGGNSGSNHNQKWQNSKRGAPGFLMTCETSREVKCQREGLEILNHYVKIDTKDQTDDKDSAPKDKKDTSSSLSFEEELKMLASKKSSQQSSNFCAYDTGCRGTVFVLCNLPDCRLIPTIKTEYFMEARKEGKQPSKDEAEKEVDSTGENEEEQKEPKPKQPKIDNPNEATSPSPRVSSPIWDPVDTARSIFADIRNDTKTAPSSRFVTRLIPIQATCFASEEELRLTSDELIKRFFPPTTKTFAITVKRRLCHTMTSNTIIETVATNVMKFVPACKVQLDDPQVTIVVEICKTVCGISVIQNVREYHKFNLHSNAPPPS
jgi:tRNA acetyltransferase TAN1